MALFDGNTERSAEDFVANLKTFQAATTRDALRLSRLWMPTFFVGLFFSLSGAAVLLCSFVRGLIAD